MAEGVSLSLTFSSVSSAVRTSLLGFSSQETNSRYRRGVSHQLGDRALSFLVTLIQGDLLG